MISTHADPSLYRRCAELLHRIIGLDAATLGARAIDRAVDTALADWLGHDPERRAHEYWDALQTSDELQRALIEAVVVPETWFFRDLEAFAALGQLAQRRLQEAAGMRSLRILSLPCSTGEEPYTIAMALLGSGLEPQQFSIDAMDISEHALARAKQAVYGRNSFRGNALAFRDAWFSPVADGWQLSPRLAATVRFRRANLLQLEPSLRQAYDFVFCRNVLIYFDRDTQWLALAELERTLMPGGTLFVGHAEGGLLTRYGMRAVKFARAFAFQRETTAATSDVKERAVVAPATMVREAFSSAAVPGSTRTFAVGGPAARVGSLADSPVAARDWTRDAHRDVAATRGMDSWRRPFQPAVGQTSGRIDAPVASAGNEALEASQALADAGRLDEAAERIADFLTRHPTHAHAYYLMGVIADARGDAGLARGHYKKAIYLDPKHREALLHLGALLELAGDNAGASLLMQRAGRIEDLS